MLNTLDGDRSFAFFSIAKKHTILNIVFSFSNQPSVTQWPERLSKGHWGGGGDQSVDVPETLTNYHLLTLTNMSDYLPTCWPASSAPASSSRFLEGSAGSGTDIASASSL